MITTLISYIVSYFILCTSSLFNASQCLKVWEYLPGYIADLYRFQSTTPYQQEKDYLNEITRKKSLQEGWKVIPSDD